MRADHKERISTCYKTLTEDVKDVDSIAGSLFSRNVLIEQEREDIEHAGGPTKRMKKLLEILDGRPPEPCAYSALVEVLKEHGCEHVAEELERVETTADPKKHTEVNPSEYDDIVRKCLLKYFTVTSKDVKLPLNDIRQVVSQEARIPGGFNWKKDRLKAFVLKTFSVDYIIGTGRNKPVIIKNLIRKHEAQVEHQTGAVGGATSTSHDADDNLMLMHSKERKDDIRAMDSAELKDFLNTFFSDKKIETDLPTVLEKNQITGNVLLTMNESDIKECCSDAGFGERRCLSILINDILERDKHKATKMYESLRKFDCNTDPSLRYTKGYFVNITEDSRGKMLKPMRNFHSIEGAFTYESQFEDAICEVIKFASACLNECQNGTIYFGITATDGEIVGVQMKSDGKEKFKSIFSDKLKDAFRQQQAEIVEKTVRNPVFVEVSGDTRELSVIEIDIVPSYKVRSCFPEPVNPKSKFLGLPTKKSNTAAFRFSREGVPENVSHKEMEYFVTECIRHRGEVDKTSLPVKKKNIRKQLQEQMAGGREKVEDSVYPFVIMSPLSSQADDTSLLENFSFLKHLKAEVVFDFDPHGSTKGIYNVMNSDETLAMFSLTLDNFDRNISVKDNKLLTGKLRFGDMVPWVFCNGYESMKIKTLSTFEWNKQKRAAFQECLKTFSSKISQSRTLVIIILLSKDYDTMIAGCEEILTTYPTNWVLLAESENIAQQWIETMASRHKVSASDSKYRCITGAPWDQINAEMKHLFTSMEVSDCQLPRSNGIPANVDPKRLADWSCVEILSAADPKLPDDEAMTRRKVEESFYAGGTADWLNFYFENQVLARTIHDDLKKKVSGALERSEDEELVTSVFIYHQPGAGGTTSAKQILWDFRKDYRCCVVKNITADETCDQLIQIRNHQDQSPKPIIILVDNEDEDKCMRFLYSLEEKCKVFHRELDIADCVYATVLVCIRRVSLPFQIHSNAIALRHRLDKRERRWLEDKHTELVNQSKEGGTEPKYLFSFNIMKDNFKTEGIDSVVKEFVKSIDCPSEIELLTSVALLNSYQFKPVPVSCFDHIFKQPQHHASAKLGRQLNWEATLSLSVKFLVNLSEAGFRVLNIRVAQSLLNHLMIREKKKLGEVMQKLIDSPEFDRYTDDAKVYGDTIGNIMKSREVKDSGDRDYFSHFIMDVIENEGEDVALQLFIHLYERNDDPFTVQQIARFLMKMKRWKEAEKYAKLAVRILPTNTYLLDTHGHVYRNQVFDMSYNQRAMGSTSGLRQDDVCKIIHLTMCAVECFKKEQEVAEKYSNGENSLAGYFGELKTLIMLLQALEKSGCFSDRAELRKYLSNPSVKMPSLSFLQQNVVDFLKSLDKSYKETMRRLDEEYLQLKTANSMKRLTGPLDLKINKDVLFGLMVSFSDYFCEQSREEHLSPEDQRVYMFEKAKAKGVMSLNILLHLRKTEGSGPLDELFSLLHNIVGAETTEFDHLLAVLNVVTVLYVDRIIPEGLRLPTILNWCLQLYRAHESYDSKRQYLERYLYFFMFNFPTDERKKHALCSVGELERAQKKWRDAFLRNFSSTDEKIRKKRERTLFFLGKGHYGQDIIHQDSLGDMKSSNTADKWHSPDFGRLLRALKGTLLPGGDEIITFFEKEEANFSLKIPTAYKVRDKRLWQTTVYFYVGFSFAGPKAFAVSKNPPDLDQAGELESYKPNTRNPREHQQKLLPLSFLNAELKELADKKRRLRQSFETARDSKTKKELKDQILCLRSKEEAIQDKINMLVN